MSEIIARAFTMVNYVIVGAMTWNILPTGRNSEGQIEFPIGTNDEDIVLTFKGVVNKDGATLKVETFTLSAHRFATATAFNANAESNTIAFTVREYAKGRNKAERILDEDAATLLNSLFPTS